MADISKLREQLAEGCIAAFYSQSAFCKVKPALPIDKVTFSFVKIDTGGKGFDIYVDSDAFDTLCDQILSGSFVSTLAKDNGDYPSAWEYVTGDNGSDHLAIGRGQKKPIVLQGRIAGGTDKDIKNIQIGISDYDSLRVMAKWWKRASAAYYGLLTDLLVDGMKKNDSYHATEASKATPKAEPVAEKEKLNKETTQPSLSSVEGGTQAVYMLIPIEGISKASNFKDDKPCYKVRCVEKESGKEVEVIFLNNYISKDVDTFNRLLDVLQSGKRPPFRVEGVFSTYKGQEQLRFLKFPPAKEA